MARKPFSFAHLVGLNRSAAARAADEKDDDEDDDNQGKKARGRRAEEKDEREEDDPDAEEDDDDDPDADDKGDDPDADEGDDKDGEDDDDKPDARRARSAERKRCARIFGSRHAAANPALAASLAFNTGMSSSAAIRVMHSSAGSAAPQGKTLRRSLDERMRASGSVRLGPDGQQARKGSADGVVEKMTGLYNSARGKK